jgi:diguanylate cyclase (GGDEF)-like protein
MSDVHCLEMLNVLCPMHVVIGPDGTIECAGPTVEKLLPDGYLIGRPFLDIFTIDRPRAIHSVAALQELAGTKLHLQFRDPPHRTLKGVLMVGPGAGQITVNLSFGIFVVDAIQEYGLTAADFAATDLTIEMLYLVEAKSAAMEASRQLNARLQTARISAEKQALTDTLTGLKNRRAMDQDLARLISNRDSFALMHVDLDFFKAVNDTLGHAAGDHVLHEVAKVMLEETRSNDTVARVGGDEFVILVKGVEDKDKLERIGERVIARLSVPIPFEDKTCRISASIGTVLAGSYSATDADQMLGDADAALYASKRAGRGRHTFFELDMRNETQTVIDRVDPETWTKTA